MGEAVTLTGADGARIGAYVARPAGTPKGAIVVLQEIFGVNAHIRRVADGYAGAGYLAVAPALFDRAGAGVELGYTPEDFARGIALKQAVPLADTLTDIAAAVAFAKQGGKVGVVGYCWGGYLAYMAAARVEGVAAAVGYYGGGIAGALEEKLNAPVMLHFGEKDQHITAAHVAAIKAALHGTPVFTDPADHAFNRFGAAPYDEASAKLALGRTLDFFGEWVG